jgi:hypothetical protein
MYGDVNAPEVITENVILVNGYGAGRAYFDYKDRAKEWESLYGENAKPKSLNERMQEYQQKADEQNRDRRIYSKDRGAR